MNKIFEYAADTKNTDSKTVDTREQYFFSLIHQISDILEVSKTIFSEREKGNEQ